MRTKKDGRKYMLKKRIINEPRRCMFCGLEEETPDLAKCEFCGNEFVEKTDRYGGMIDDALQKLRKQEQTD